MTTKAIFRYSPKHNEVFAFFPYDVNNDETVEAYGEKSGHMTLEYNYNMRKSKPATKEQADALKFALESVGYKIETVERRNRFYEVLSPDGNPIQMSGFFANKKEAQKAAQNWAKGFSDLGTYHTSRGKEIPVSILAKCCDIIRMG
jgi:hypothetical protein